MDDVEMNFAFSTSGFSIRWNMLPKKRINTWLGTYLIPIKIRWNMLPNNKQIPIQCTSRSDETCYQMKNKYLSNTHESVISTEMR